MDSTVQSSLKEFWLKLDGRVRATATLALTLVEAK